MLAKNNKKKIIMVITSRQSFDADYILNLRIISNLNYIKIINKYEIQYKQIFNVNLNDLLKASFVFF